MAPEQLQAAPCRGKTAMFTVPTDLDPNPRYHEQRAKALCALCPADTFRACGAEAEGDHVMIRQGATPTERRNGAHNRRPLTEPCGACGTVSWSVYKGIRKCSECQRIRDRERYRARGR